MHSMLKSNYNIFRRKTFRCLLSEPIVGSDVICGGGILNLVLVLENVLCPRLLIL